MAISSARAEEAVRRYLTYLKDPQSLVDEGKVARAQSKLDRAIAGGDVIEHITALAALEAARVVDETPVRAAFVAALPQWAEEHGVSVSVLRSFGVPDDDLVAAKVLTRDQLRRLRDRDRGTPARAARPAKKAAAPVADGAAPVASNGHRANPGSVDYDAIVAMLPPPGTTWLTTDVVELLGVNVGTARNRIARLRERGLVRDVGEVRPWTAKGSPPHLYERT